MAVTGLATAAEVGLDAATRRDGSLRAVYLGDVRATVPERVARLIAVAGEAASRARTNGPAATAADEAPRHAGIVIRRRLGCERGR